MAESLSLARAATSDGTQLVLCTPHVSPGWVEDPREIPVRVRELAEALRRERIPLQVRPGGELAYTMVGRLDGKQLSAIAHGPAEQRWVLLEGSFDGLDEQFTLAADELRERGFAVVVAHPERIVQNVATQRALEHELAAGSVLQLTAEALVAGDAEAFRLLRSAAPAVIASDAHGGARPPALSLAVSALAAAGDPDPARFAEGIPWGLVRNGLGRFPAGVVG
jgi:protein-tyrosine phosphatase